MEKKIMPSQKAIVKTVRTTLKTIVSAFGEWPCKMWAEVEKSGLQVAGAAVFVYRGCDENPDTEFELQMCVPVVDYSAYQGEFEKVELQEFTCLESLFVGSMPDIGPKGWTPFMTEVMQKNIAFTKESREVYIKWVDFNSPDNQVLMQIGV